MPKNKWRHSIAVCAAVLALGVVLPGRQSSAQSAPPGAAQPGATTPAARQPATIDLLTELRHLRKLPDSLSERRQLADVAVTTVRRNASQRLLHAFHEALLAPPFIPAPRRFVTVPVLEQPYPRACKPDRIYSSGAFPSIVKQHQSDADPAGCEGTYLPGGAVPTNTNAFFMQLGTNGRSCASCHQPPSGMSVSADNIGQRLTATHGTDAIFAGVDGANCPDNLPPFDGSGSTFRAAHSLLLHRGVFRIAEAMPAGAEFTVSAAGHDPNGCNTTSSFSHDTIGGVTTQMVSAYRRPRISASLNFVEAFFAPPGPPSGAAIMWDTRETSLQQQAQDATIGHAGAQGTAPVTDAQAAQIVAFETTIFSAESVGKTAGRLSDGGANGGPVALSKATPGQGAPPATASFDEYAVWAGLGGGAVNRSRASIARGETLFTTRKFTITNVAGLNDLPGLPVPFQATCSGCHSQTHAGDDIFGKAGVFDLGVAGDSASHGGPAPAKDLPIFTVSCQGGKSTPFNGSTVTTNDLGFAMVTGKCADISKFSVPQLRGVSSHPPFFHDGSAQTLEDVVNFYDGRFTIGLKPSEKQDLVNFLRAL